MVELGLCCGEIVLMMAILFLNKKLSRSKVDHKVELLLRRVSKARSLLGLTCLEIWKEKRKLLRQLVAVFLRRSRLSLYVSYYSLDLSLH